MQKEWFNINGFLINFSLTQKRTHDNFRFMRLAWPFIIRVSNNLFFIFVLILDENKRYQIFADYNLAKHKV